MKLVQKMSFAMLVVLILAATVRSQTLRTEDDPRNLSPTVGTGGSPGGPTGLFTIYDGQTLRRGEFTFSVAYSKWARDPGDADFTEVPISFNIGINDHLELFFTTDVYRKVKARNFQHLSGFYMPNTPDANGCVRAAIIQPPVGVSGGISVFLANALSFGLVGLDRPACTQANVPFPFVGSSGPTFGLTGNNIAPPVTTRLVLTSSGGSGVRSHAAIFGGIGSAFGSILPGVVLTTRTIPPNLTFATLTVPDLFAVQPSYLPDAPFLGFNDQHTSFGTISVGGKIRFTGPKNPLGIAIVPFWRWHLDKPDDAQGFGELQRGASPGSSWGDFGAVAVVDGRLSRSVNVSANLGYLFTTNPRTTIAGQKVVLLDRPDEVYAGIGFDFPVNKHFQPIFELKSIQYVGAHTPNAFGNNPVEVLGGAKIYFRRNVGVSAVYRRHLNQQSSRMFEDGLPVGFIPSDDPKGFMFQFWAGNRNRREPAILPNQAPTVTLSTSSATVTLPCPEGTTSTTCTPTSNQVQLSANATDPDGDTLLYTYTVTGGRITGDGPNSTWDLTGVTPGTYTASVEVDDGCGCIAFSSTTVTIAECTGCVPPCPTIQISCPTDAGMPGSPATVSVNVSGGGNFNITYNWTVSAGTISGGQGTPSITIDTTGQAGQNITATVEIGGLPPECDRTRSCTLPVVTPIPDCRKFDSYGDIRFNDEKARLDPFAVALQNEPGSTGYITAYGTCAGDGPCTHTSCIVAMKRAERAKDYLVNTRGIDAARIVITDGGCRAEVTVDLWVCPTGTTAPFPDLGPAVDPCPECKRPTRRPRRGRRGEE